jgi:hypothetical protein
MIAAFSGWNDAGDAASDAVRWLVRASNARPFAALDIEEYLDFQAARPTVDLVDGVVRMITWPALALSGGTLAASDRDLVLLLGVEPNLRWPAFCDDVIGVARKTGCEIIVTLGALLGDTPHSRPIRCTGSATDEVLAARLGMQRSRYEGPTGIVGVLHDACNTAHIPSVSLWAAVPHYVSLAPSPRAALALCHRLGDILGTEVDTAELDEAAERYSEQVSEAVASDEETAQYVAELEERAEILDDEQEIPSGESLAAELTRFLRDRERGNGGPESSGPSEQP